MTIAARTDLRFGRVALAAPVGLTYRAITDVAVDGHGHLHVLTRGCGVVVVHDVRGHYLRTYGQFVHAHGLVIDAAGDVHVVDEGAHRVVTFAPDGSERGSLGTGEPSDSGCDWSRPTYKEKYLSIIRGAGPFNRPTAVAIAADGSRYVTDGYGNSRVHHFAPDGHLIRSWGEPGSAPGEFRLPHGICVLPGGDVLVADRENDRLQRFSPTGAHLSSWDGLQRPAKPILTSSGRVVVGELARPVGDYSFASGEITEALAPRISVFDLDGTLVARETIPPRPNGEPSSPHGLAEGIDGTIYAGELATPGGPPVTSLVTMTIT